MALSVGNVELSQPLPSAAETAESDWINTIKRVAKQTEEFQKSCTPGYYNQEGTSKRYRDVRRETYSKGVGAYMKLLQDWREANALEGLELS